NKKTYLKNCLESLLAQTYRPVEIIVVDNGSEDGSLDMLKERFGRVKLISNRSNALYCRAQNQGIGAAQGDYIICLNNDVVLEKDFVQKLAESAGIDRKIGMVCGKILLMDKTTLDSAGQILGRARKPVERGYKQRDRGLYNQPGYVFSAGGVAPLYKRRMLEDIWVNGQYFDESYGMFYEDLDIAWRANSLGWRGFYNPQGIAYHHRGGTAKTGQPRLNILKRYDFTYLPPELKTRLVKNRYMTILKNDCLKDVLINLPWIIGYEIKLWAYLVIFHPRLTIKIVNELFRQSKDAYKKRREIKRLGIWKKQNSSISTGRYLPGD
ncbi:MAG: glycosyltransferase family 2 protein, partial [Candidatus Omnitrophota bacterium]